MPNRLTDLPATPEPSTVILLASLGPLREALFRASCAVRNGRFVIILCFRKDIYDLLKPLETGDWKLAVYLSDKELAFQSATWIRDLWAIRSFEANIKKLSEGRADVEAWVYGTSISLSAIAAAVTIAKQHSVYYQGIYEGRDAEDGIFRDPTKQWTRRLKGKLLGWILGAKICYCRDWSPAPVLTGSFVSRNFLPAQQWDRSAISHLERQLRRSCPAKVLVLFTNFASYYPTTDGDAAQCNILLDSIQMIVKKMQVSCAVKPHPTSGQLLDSWCWMDQIPPAFPVELCDFPNLKVVLGDASTAMIHFLNGPSVTVISYAALLKVEWKCKVVDYLTQRVDPGGKIAQPKTLDGFRAALSNALQKQ
jgi:hypothetical protein